MNAPTIAEIYQKIEVLNPLHGKKLKKNLPYYDEKYYKEADDFLNKYAAFLTSEHKDFDYAVDCYLNMIADVTTETMQFLRTGKYSSTTFSEVNDRVYSNPETMEYYMHGLVMSQFLWKHHYQIFEYFINTLPQFKSKVKHYLEVGAGHGLYLAKAAELLNPGTTLTVIDISNTSIELSKNFVNDNRIVYHLANIFEIEVDKSYDFITMGEVLEHVEDPVKLLSRLGDFLSDDGTAFITTPTNAPAIDHISLFESVQQIRDIIHESGFEIVSEKSFPSEDMTPEKADKLKIAILYGAFLKKSGK